MLCAEMTVPRAQASISVLLASAALVSLPSTAQPGLLPSSQPERELAIIGAADQPPAVVYGAPDWPLMLSFDAPVKKDAALTVSGADVRLHPFLPNAIVITPSSAFAAQSSVPVLVPLADGVVALTLAFSPAKRDTRVRVVRRASSAQPAATDDELRELLTYVVRTALDSGACVNAVAPALPRPVEQGSGSGPIRPLVCGGGTWAYARVNASADCQAETARLTRGKESADVLLLEPATVAYENETCWLVVARVPPGDGLGFELELFAQDGVPCHSIAVNLKPPSR